MKVVVNQNAPLTVVDEEGKLLFEWKPNNVINLQVCNNINVKGSEDAAKVIMKELVESLRKRGVSI